MRNLSEPVRQCIEERLSVEVGRLAERFSAPGQGNKIQVEIYLPWNRLFEVGLTVKFECKQTD